jgi:cardiolipin synthase
MKINLLKKHFLVHCFVLSALVFTGCSNSEPSKSTTDKVVVVENTPEESERLILTPEEVQAPIIEAINNAKEKIDLSNFHLSNRDVVKALIDASVIRQVKIRIILDAGTLSKSAPAQKIVQDLKAANIEVKPGSKFFSITHQKSFVIDGTTALVSSINLVTTAAKTRDFGLFIHNKNVIDEINSVFQADWDNADTNGGVTPALENERLVWSPVNSLPKLRDLIMSAKSEIKVMVENLGSTEISEALIAKSKEGIAIQVLTPGCLIGNALRNRPFIKVLSENKIENKVSSARSDAEHPYVHAKMILVDNHLFYIGSENFSFNSLQRARELGIITDDSGAAKKITETFNHDWKNGFDPDAVTVEDCKNTTGTKIETKAPEANTP